MSNFDSDLLPFRHAVQAAAFASFLALGSGAVTITPALAQATCTMTPSGTATAGGAGAFACGPGAVANGDSSTSVGAGAGAGSGSGDQNTFVGAAAGSDANGASNSYLGMAAGFEANGDINTYVGLGAGASSTGDENVGTGREALVANDGNRNVAAGSYAGAYVTGDDNVAIGSNAGGTTIGDRVYFSRTVAVGSGALAGVDEAVALGAGAQATHVNSMAIGANVATDRENQVKLGSASNTYTLAGVASSDSLAAQTGPIYFVTSDASGNLATTDLDIQQLGSLDGRVGTLETTFSSLDGRIDKAFEGTAMALAMAGGGLPSDKNYALSINWGTFEGENAFAGSGAIRLNDYLHLHGGVGVGASQGTVGGRAGMTLAW